jgi:MarR family transcriptional regulator, organic hydroperoxide resistance regulator
MDARDDLLKLDNQVCFAIVTAARNVVSIYRPVLEPLGLTHPQYLVMLALWERAPRSLRDLADDLALEPATLSPIVKRMETQGLVRRTRRESDERMLDIDLTEKGRVLRTRALEVPGQIMARVGLSPDDLVRLRDGLAPFAGRRAERDPRPDLERA